MTNGVSWATTDDVEIEALPHGYGPLGDEHVTEPMALAIGAPGADTVTVIEGTYSQLVAVLARAQAQLAAQHNTKEKP